MTAISAPAGDIVAHRGAVVNPVIRLAAAEGRRILLHPVHLLFGAAWVAVMGLSGVAVARWRSLPVVPP